MTTAEVGCPGKKHGDYSAYTAYGCRCPDARQEHNRYQTRLRMEHLRGVRRKVDATGTLRRLRALNAIGWSDTELAVMLGISKSQMCGMQRRAHVHRSTALRVEALYLQLHETPGGNQRAIHRAERNGWLEPKWWDDDLIDDPSYMPSTDLKVHWSDVDPVAVERACQGDAVALTPAERIRAVVELHQRGANDCEIGRRLRMDPAQVWRDRTSPRQLVAV